MIMVNENIEKDIFDTLQKIKLKINYLLNEIDDNERNIELKNNEELENSTNYYNLYKQYRNLKIKYIILSVLTMGLYHIKDKYDYKMRREILEEALDKLSVEYDYIINEIATSEETKIQNKEKLSKYREYYSEIDEIQLLQNCTDEYISKRLQYIKSQLI